MEDKKDITLNAGADKAVLPEQDATVQKDRLKCQTCDFTTLFIVRPNRGKPVTHEDQLRTHDETALHIGCPKCDYVTFTMKRLDRHYGAAHWGNKFMKRRPSGNGNAVQNENKRAKQGESGIENNGDADAAKEAKDSDASETVLDTKDFAQEEGIAKVEYDSSNPKGSSMENESEYVPIKEPETVESGMADDEDVDDPDPVENVEEGTSDKDSPDNRAAGPVVVPSLTQNLISYEVRDSTEPRAPTKNENVKEETQEDPAEVEMNEEPSEEGILLELNNDVYIDENRCDVCGDYADDQASLCAHLWDEHGIKRDLPPGGKTMDCSDCDFKAATGTELEVHVKAKHALWKNLKTAPPDLIARGRYDCNVCSFQASERKAFVEHCKDAHDKVIFPCKHCVHDAATEAGLENHVSAAHESTGQKSLPASDTMSLLREKKMEASQKVSKPRPVDTPSENVLCNDCGSTFKNDRSLVAHQYRKHAGSGNLQRSHLCSECGLAFKTDAALRAHSTRKHYRGNPTDAQIKIRCALCIKSTSDRASMKHHMIRHLDAPLIEAKCDQVDCEFASDDLLKLEEHLEKTHSDVTEAKECVHCTFSSRHPPVMSAHALIHEKRFQCHLCGFKCLSNAGLERHVSGKHLKVGRLVCDVCGLEVRNGHLLQRHKAAKHKDVKAYRAGGQNK